MGGEEGGWVRVVMLLVLLAFFVKDLVYWWGWWMPFMIAWLGITLAWRLFFTCSANPSAKMIDMPLGFLTCTILAKSDLLAYV